jgi:hypothetical protein
MDLVVISSRVAGAAAGMAKKYREKMIQERLEYDTTHGFLPAAARALIPIVEKLTGTNIDFDYRNIGDGVPSFASLLHECEHILLDKTFDLRNFQYTKENAIDGLAAEMFLDDLASYADTNKAGRRWINIFEAMLRDIGPKTDMTIFAALDFLDSLESKNSANKALITKISRRIRSALESSEFADIYKTQVYFYKFHIFDAKYPDAFDYINEVFTDEFSSMDIHSTSNSQAEEIFLKFYRNAYPVVRRLLKEYEYVD